MTNIEYIKEILGDPKLTNITEDTDKFIFGKDIEIEGEIKLLMFEFYVQNRYIKLIRNLNRLTIQGKEIDLGFDQKYYPKSGKEFKDILYKIKLRIENKLKEPENKNNVLNYFYTAIITQEYKKNGIINHAKDIEDFNSENKEEVIEDLKLFFDKYPMDKPIKIRVLKVVESFDLDVEDIYTDFELINDPITGGLMYKLKQ